ncbi:DinB family protein [Aureibacter tunicatorum]|uniref:DinB-like domain-containing protein n=1 Tax=Aureibacter tunicatorum TaxID=866807 RepID=A0AAE3XLU1_9BACT|nr:DinB family protein [Aureibacter tunicatorum]MDR6238807.1 hypothetical protein [Aureibacter tunicatorum]BDD05266.1 hypothetical protein AUTU_27490 [Aureibacter tunicatorum]
MKNEFLLQQTQDSYNWLNKIIKDIPLNQWDETPKNIETNITWQIGHLIMSFNFHTIIVIKGQPMHLYQNFPVKLYSELFTNSPAKDCIGKTIPKELQQHLELVQNYSLETIKNLPEEELVNPLEPFVVKHPIAKTKQEAIDWNIKHTMWHCGQIGLLKRALGNQHNFGLNL